MCDLKDVVIQESYLVNTHSNENSKRKCV